MRHKTRLFIIVFLILFFSSSYVQAEDRGNTGPIGQMEISISAQSLPKETLVEAIDYTLPYPGMLPDSPFYVLKVIRDKIISLLISDPLKKAEFDLLQADKRLQAGVFLTDKDKSKTSLVISTISKGQNYFEEAIYKIQEAKKQGKDTSSILDKLITASRKHKEVLQGLEKNAGKEVRESIMVMGKRMEEFEKIAMKIKQ